MPPKPGGSFRHIPVHPSDPEENRHFLLFCAEEIVFWLTKNAFKWQKKARFPRESAEGVLFLTLTWFSLTNTCFYKINSVRIKTEARATAFCSSTSIKNLGQVGALLTARDGLFPATFLRSRSGSIPLSPRSRGSVGLPAHAESVYCKNSRRPVLLVGGCFFCCCNKRRCFIFFDRRARSTARRTESAPRPRGTGV